jgi:hypothetical protein
MEQKFSNRVDGNRYLSLAITPEKNIVKHTQYQNNSKVFNYSGGVTSDTS